MNNSTLKLLYIPLILITLLISIIIDSECIIFIVSILSLFIRYFNSLYNYNKIKHNLSSISFEMRKNNLLINIIFLFIFGFALNNAYSKRHVNFELIDYNLLFEFSLFLSALLEVYISFFQKPILSSEGFLSSDGNFLDFNNINSILIEDTLSDSVKRITVTYTNNNSILNKIGETVDSISFKISILDYESIKSYIKIYVPNKLFENSIR